MTEENIRLIVKISWLIAVGFVVLVLFMKVRNV